jgi:hypothetical protein
VSIREHTSDLEILWAAVSIRENTSAYVSIRENSSDLEILGAGGLVTAISLPFVFAPLLLVPLLLAVLLLTPSAYVSIRQHTSAYVSIRQHTSPTSFSAPCRPAIKAAIKALLRCHQGPINALLRRY